MALNLTRPQARRAFVLGLCAATLTLASCQTGRRPVRPGPIVDVAGRTLGTHGGLAAYTVGQRRGLGLVGDTPRYVVDLDPTTNTLTVGPATTLERDRLIAADVNFIACDPPDAPLDVEAKIRHNHRPARARVRMVDDRQAEVVFAEPQRAVTPGQSVVWYQGDLVVGGGVICL